MKLKQGDFPKLYKRLRPKILRYVMGRVSSKEDAEDLTEEVFVKVYKKLDDFKWQGVSIDSWVYRIAKNAIIDYYRKNNKYKNMTDFETASLTTKDSEVDLLADMLEDESKKELYIAISKLDPKDQYLIYYKYFEELSVAEISKKVGLSETNVATKLHRLRSKILKLTKTKS
ncbi:MAG: RNA polymerase sigma factor [Candidatus Dojkabacteria bacterium]